LADANLKDLYSMLENSWSSFGLVSLNVPEG
jgi:hypothetical protein